MEGAADRAAVPGTKAESGVCHSGRTENQSKQSCVGQISHAGDQACAHGHKDGRDLPGGARGRTETYQAEGTSYRYAGAHIAVHHHNDHAYYRWQESQGNREAAAAA